MFFISNRDSVGYWQAVAASSDAIKVARVFCIFLMSYVHLHFLNYDLSDSDLFIALRTVFVDVLGRSSVPLLSVVSGFLAWGVFQKERNISIFKNRARKILVPMIVWNALGASLVLLKSGAFPAAGFFNSIFPLVGPGAYMHLDFLRDIYAMTLVTPFLIYLARRVPLLVGLVAFGVLIFDVDVYFVLRGQIFFFYLLGIFIALYKFEFDFSNLFGGFVLVFIFIGVSAAELVALYGYGPTGYYYDNFFRRPLMAICSWFFCVWLARSYFASWFFYLERYVFVFFLSHVFVFGLIGAVFSRVNFLHGSIGYPVIWLISPVVAYSLVIAMRFLGGGILKQAIIESVSRLFVLRRRDWR